MEWFKQIWEQVSTLFKWWVVVLPWEQGVKVWLGKNTKTIGAGIHFRVPYLHVVYVQTIRTSFINLSPQTLTTKSGETLTIALIAGYSITDMYKLYNSVGEVESAITGIVTSKVAQFVSSNELKECCPKSIEAHVKNELKETGWGVDVTEISITSYAAVRTYRIIQDGHWMGTSHKLDQQIK